MPSIVITGFMGCGKTEVAQKLADALRCKSIDLDYVITQREGKSPAQLISEDGERYFRIRETTALTSILETEPFAVISLGGGAWIEEENRRLIEQFRATSVWLDVPFDVCWQRILESAEDRPLGRSREQAHELYYPRLALYKLAQIHIEHLANESAEQLSRRIATRIGAEH